MFRAVCFVALGIVVVPETARAAATYLVNSVLDAVDDNVSDSVCHTAAGTCTLRAAIMQANHYSGNGNVVISLPAGTYVLTIAVSGSDGEDSGDLNVTAPPAGSSTFAITGSGAGTTIIDADQLDRAFNIARAATISGLTVRNGFAGNGGGILNQQGDLTLSDAVVELCQASQGGGIQNDGFMTLNNVVVKGNSAMFGGGISTSYDLTVRNSTIKSNTSSGGGGVFNTGDMTIDRSTISANASTGSGGGISNIAFSGTTASMKITNSTLSDNHADTNGGGIATSIQSNGTLNVNIFSSSIIANEAAAKPASGGKGGGMYLNSGSLFTLHNSLIAGNYLSGGSSYEDCYSPGTLINSYGLNLFSAAPTNCPFNNSSAVGSTTMLTIGPLQDNGGPTFTHALLEGSNAIGAVASASCTGSDSLPILVDQRGVSRVTDGFCDVGAFEYDFSRIFANGFDPP